MAREELGRQMLASARVNLNPSAAKEPAEAVLERVQDRTGRGNSEVERCSPLRFGELQEESGKYCQPRKAR